MAKVTWLGEPGPGPDDEGPQENTWAGRTFKKGEAVDIEDENLLEIAAGNRFYKVEGYKPRAERQQEFVPPSQQGTQFPVPKPGEPVPQSSPQPETRPVGPQAQPSIPRSDEAPQAPGPSRSPPKRV